jgi:hypothetical protein
MWKLIRLLQRALPGACTLLLLAASGCGPRPAAAGPVPWLDHPAVAPTPAAAPTPVPEPACLHVSATAGRAGAAGGTHSESVQVTNTGTAPCLLAGYPTSLVGLTSTGVAVSLNPEDTDASQYIPTDLAPGQSGELTILTLDMCGLSSPGHVFVGVRVGLPSGVVIAVPLVLNTSCGRPMLSELGASPPPEVLPHSHLDVLTAALGLPRSMTAGAVATYTVTIRNPTAGAVALDPCPVCTEGLKAVSASVRTYRLNCPPSIPPHGTVTFAMRLRIPPGLRAGTRLLVWSIPDTRIATSASVTLAS